MDTITNTLQDKMNDVLSSLNVDATCIAAERNRHLAFFDVQTNKTKVSKLESLSREISMGLRSKTNPIITLIPEEGIVRFRCAMREADTILFEELYKKHTAPDGILPFLLGECDNGEPLWLDMATNPHMLVAGSTGSGKSVLLHVLIRNAMLREDVELMLIDPKFGVEFSKYEDQCSLAKDYDEAVSFLEMLNDEMNLRYQRMAQLKVQSIEKSNIFFKKLLIIDEVADLMLIDNAKSNKNKGKFESLLCSIAQKARACGIYIVIATQRPSVDVITGLIKANFPARLACKVSTATDSKVVLDRSGAETLLGRGDAILNSAKHHYARFQVAFC